MPYVPRSHATPRERHPRPGERVRRRCPVCGGKDSEHNMYQHTLNFDIKKAGVDFAAIQEERQETATLQRQAEKLGQVRKDDPEVVSVVLQAEKLIKGITLVD